MLAHKPWEVNKTSHIWESRNLQDYKILQGHSLVLQKVKKKCWGGGSEHLGCENRVSCQSSCLQVVQSAE